MDSPLDADLLAILVCPETHQALRLATAAELAAVNARVAAGQQRRRDGSTVPDPLPGLLLRTDGKVGYEIRDGFPRLVVELALPLVE